MLSLLTGCAQSMNSIKQLSKPDCPPALCVPCPKLDLIDEDADIPDVLDYTGYVVSEYNQCRKKDAELIGRIVDQSK